MGLGLGTVLGSAAISGGANLLSNLLTSNQANANIGRAISDLEDTMIDDEELDKLLRQNERRFSNTEVNKLNEAAIQGRNVLNSGAIKANIVNTLNTAEIESEDRISNAVADRNASIQQQIAQLNAGRPVQDTFGSFIGGAIQGGIAGAQAKSLIDSNEEPDVDPETDFDPDNTTSDTPDNTELTNNHQPNAPSKRAEAPENVTDDNMNNKIEQDQTNNLTQSSKTNDALTQSILNSGVKTNDALTQSILNSEVKTNDASTQSIINSRVKYVPDYSEAKYVPDNDMESVQVPDKNYLHPAKKAVETMNSKPYDYVYEHPTRSAAINTQGFTKSQLQNLLVDLDKKMYEEDNPKKLRDLVNFLSSQGNAESDSLLKHLESLDDADVDKLLKSLQ